MVKSRNIIATPPGATIREQLLDRGMRQKEFAARMGMSEKHISNLINGDVQLTPDVAVRLEMVLGVPSKFWCRLEAIYREKLIKAHAENEMEADILLSEKFPYTQMAEIGWLPKACHPQEKVINLRKYFEVVRLSLIEDPHITHICCRRPAGTEKSDYSFLAWAQKARLEARKVFTEPVNLKKLSQKLPQIRALTIDAPAIFCPKLRSILAECGVALVFLPYIGELPLHGAAFRDGRKIVVGLALHGRDTDKFWFSLFHELAHILKGHIEQFEGTSEQDEREADLFAQNQLIPPQDFTCFLAGCDFSKKAVIEFARRVDIAPGIAVGLLQKKGMLQTDQYNDLKDTYTLA